MYKDITTHSRNEKEREPRILENTVNGVKFVVHKHIAYEDEWILTCRELNIDKKSLHTDDMEEAKEKALREMVKLLENAILKYKNAIVELLAN